MVSPLKLSLRNLSQKDIVPPSSSSESMQGKCYHGPDIRLAGYLAFVLGRDTVLDIRPIIRPDIKYPAFDIRWLDS